PIRTRREDEPPRGSSRSGGAADGGTSPSCDPLPHLDGGAAPHARRNIEFIHEPFGPRQTHAKSACGGEAHFEGSADIRDPRPFIEKNNFQTLSSSVER